MRYLILLEGQGGELDRRETDNEDDLNNLAISLVTGAVLSPGDTISFIDTKPEE